MNEPPRPYVRPMQGWWHRDLYFIAYMARELTAFAVLAYSIVLVVGLVRLSQGEAAWNGWLAAVRSPSGFVLHAVCLVSFIVHCKSWFDIMPKTMPMIFSHGKHVPPRRITQAGYGLAIVSAIALLAVAKWVLA